MVNLHLYSSFFFLYVLDRHLRQHLLSTTHRTVTVLLSMPNIYLLYSLVALTTITHIDMIHYYVSYSPLNLIPGSNVSEKSLAPRNLFPPGFTTEKVYNTAILFCIINIAVLHNIRSDRTCKIQEQLDVNAPGHVKPAASSSPLQLNKYICTQTLQIVEPTSHTIISAH